MSEQTAPQRKRDRLRSFLPSRGVQNPDVSAGPISAPVPVLPSSTSEFQATATSLDTLAIAEDPAPVRPVQSSPAIFQSRSNPVPTLLSPPPLDSAVTQSEAGTLAAPLSSSPSPSWRRNLWLDAIEKITKEEKKSLETIQSSGKSSFLGTHSCLENLLEMRQCLSPF